MAFRKQKKLQSKVQSKRSISWVWVFVGSIESLEMWLRGVEWARKYDVMLGLSDDKKRQRKEQDERNRQLVRILKNEKVRDIK